MVIEIQGAFGRAQDNSDHTAAGAASEWSAIYSDPPPPHPSHDFAPPPYFAENLRMYALLSPGSAGENASVTSGLQPATL